MSFQDRFRSWVSSPRISPFVPKIIVCLLEGYSKKDFFCDLTAGITVGVIALPLAMALAIASGLDPEIGLYTAIVAGMLNAIFGGSRFLIGGPTGAYVLLVLAVVQKYGYEGLVCATLEAATILFLLGFFKCGGLIRFIPYPVIIGFTCGIAVVLLATQLNDFFGLDVSQPTIDAVDKIHAAIQNAGTFHISSTLLAIFTLTCILFFKKISVKFPGVLLALCIATIMNIYFGLGIETIESKFGVIPRNIPLPHLPTITFDLLRKTFPHAIGIALLGAIESLLCAVIADSLTGTKHKSNCELIAQGIANFGSVMCGGMPSTGAIARTTTSIQLQAKTPVSAFIHSLTILILMVIFAPLASKIPLCAIASVLVYVAWNMFEFEQIKDLVLSWRSEALVMLATFIITVLVDLNAAVQVGVLISVVLFLKKTTETTTGKVLQAIEEEEEGEDLSEEKGSWRMTLPRDVKVYELEGPFFFAVSDILSDVFTRFDTIPHTLILRMRSVPFIDATASKALKRFASHCKAKNVTLFLAELKPTVFLSLENADFFETFPKDRVLGSVDEFLRSSPLNGTKKISTY